MNPRIGIINRTIFLVALACGLVSPASAQWKEQVLYSFQGGTDGSLPGGGLISDKAGNLYGVTVEGGSTACPPGWCGTIYKLSPPVQKGGAWTEKLLYVFRGHNQKDGSSPSGGLVADGAGNLYGTTGYGGSGPCVLFGAATGCGTVFELSPPKQKGGAWTETVLYNFQGGNDGDLPIGPLVFDKVGNLYGTTEFGGGQGTTCDAFYGGNCGTVFELSAPAQQGGQWTETVLHSFAGGTDGAVPNGGLAIDSKRRLYGTTTYGGDISGACDSGLEGIGCGTVFGFAPPLKEGEAWTERLIHVFKNGADGASPNGSLLLGPKGGVYGTAGGGSGQSGVVFRLSDFEGSWRETIFYTFVGGNDGSDAGTGLLFGSGDIYGTALGGGTGKGLVYRLKPAPEGISWLPTVLYNFAGAPDGNHPAEPLVFSTFGTLVGTTQWGGTGQACQGGCGVLFEISP